VSKQTRVASDSIGPRPRDLEAGAGFTQRVERLVAAPELGIAEGPSLRVTARRQVRMKAIWITWQAHRRTREIAKALDLQLFELIAPSGWLRYPRLLIRTVRCIRENAPTHLFVQCPSIVLGAWALAAKGVFGYTLVTDLHNEAIEPFINQAAWYRRVIQIIHRRSDLCLVTNEGLLGTIEAHGGRAIVLPDRVPEMPKHSRQARAERPALVVFVCSFAADEPFREVIAAAGKLSDVARVVVTGNANKVQLPSPLPESVTLTGFLPADAYDELLGRADLVVDLTSMENCLVCGAYEAIALGKALVTSDTAALRAAFPRGVLFTKHDPESIEATIRLALERRGELSSQIDVLRGEFEVGWRARKTALLTLLNGLVSEESDGPSGRRVSRSSPNS